MSYRHRLLIKGKTQKQIKQKYGNYHIFLRKVNMFEHGCSMHKHITLCNQDKNRCKHIYTVHGVSSVPMENYNTVDDWINVMGYC